MSTTDKIRVLVVDDSALVRRILSDTLSAEPDIEVVATAPDAIIATQKVRRYAPDVVTLDLDMPRMDGLTALKQLMKTNPTPVIVVSSLAQASSRAALDAIQYGAVDVVAKPSTGGYGPEDVKADLLHKVRAAAKSAIRLSSAIRDSQASQIPAIASAARPFASEIIAVGASTGGVEALRVLLRAMPSNCPPIVITQHIPPIFSKTLAERLNLECQINVSEARDGDSISSGQAVIAPGNFHMTLKSTGSGFKVLLNDGPQVCYQRPSVDVLFESVAKEAGRRAAGVLMTGMGSDGAKGLLQMKASGATTFAQDQNSCVVFGMPKEAIRLGAVDHIIPLHGLAHGALFRKPGRSADVV